MLFRWLSIGCFMASIGFFAVAGGLYFLENAGPAAVIEDIDRELPDAPAGQETELVFAIQNTGWHTVRVVGLAPC